MDAPVVLSRVFDAQHPPPHALPEHRTRTVFKTATTPGGGSFNEIRFEDQAGGEEMRISASRDLTVEVRNAKTEFVGGSASLEVESNRLLAVGGSANVRVGGHEVVRIGADETDKVDEGVERTVGGDEHASVGAARALKVGAAHDVSVVGTRSLVVGGLLLDASLGTITTTAKLDGVFVGVVALEISRRDITEDVGSTVSTQTVTSALPVPGAAASQAISTVASAFSSKGTPAGGVLQTVAMDQLEYATESRSIDVTATFRESCTRASLQADELSDSANKLTLKLTGALTASAKSVVLEAADSLELVCGGTTITLSASDIVIDTANVTLLEGSEKLLAKAALVQLNPP